MVEARGAHKAFDGVKPENVVFGETLGEGKKLIFYELPLRPFRLRTDAKYCCLLLQVHSVW